MVEALKIGHAAIGWLITHRLLSLSSATTTLSLSLQMSVPSLSPSSMSTSLSLLSQHHCHNYHHCRVGEICEAIDAFRAVAGKPKKTDTLRQLPAQLVDNIDSVSVAGHIMKRIMMMIMSWMMVVMMMLMLLKCLDSVIIVMHRSMC